MSVYTCTILGKKKKQPEQSDNDLWLLTTPGGKKMGTC